MPPEVVTFRTEFEVGIEYKFKIRGENFVLSPAPTVVISTDNKAYRWSPGIVLKSKPGVLIVSSKLAKVRPTGRPNRGMGNLTVTVTNNDGSGQSQDAALLPGLTDD